VVSRLWARSWKLGARSGAWLGRDTLAAGPYGRWRSLKLEAVATDVAHSPWLRANSPG
jgi:hypothetical protein